MIRRPPRSTRTYTLCPFASIFRATMKDVVVLAGAEADPEFLGDGFAAPGYRGAQVARGQRSRGLQPGDGGLQSKRADAAVRFPAAYIVGVGLQVFDRAAGK